MVKPLVCFLNTNMSLNRLKIVLGFWMLLSSNILFAQEHKIYVTGTVVESNSHQPVMFATVVVMNKATEKPIDGTTTLEDGTFKIIAKAGPIYFEVKFLGFVTKTITEFVRDQGKIDLGTIMLQQSATDLDAVEVRAERSQTEFRLDKRVFNVGQDLSTTGASALEVLNNVPSVNVNIEGQISLRGSSGVQVLINGKPSILASDESNALGTITADMIEKIEVITNPSAKYDAEGTAGIINIVLRKEEKKGLNGSISLNTGWPHNHSIGISVNRRTEQFNLFSQLGAGYRSLPKTSENINRDLINNTSILSRGNEYRDENFYNITLGADYHINELNVLTLSGNFAYEVEDQPSEINFESYVKDTLISEWSRKEVTQATNPKWQYEFQYQKDFEDNKEHKLLVSALGRFFGKDLSSEFENITSFGEEADPFQLTNTKFSEASFTYKADYTKPFSNGFTLETGGQYVLNDVNNNFAVSNFVNNVWISDANFTNNFEYNQKVLGLYSTLAYEKNKWGIKGGLRLENTDLTTVLTNTNEKNNQNYQNFFPSVHASYKINKKFSIQTGYSKRIYRPRLWDLNPFFSIRNNFSIRTGNPKLQPQFTDSYEVSAIYLRKKSTFNFSVFQRVTTEVIERISTFKNNVNLLMPMNVGNNYSTGVEFNGKYNIGKKVSFLGDANYSLFQRRGTFENTSFDFNGNRWSAKLTSKVKLPYKIDIEATGRYRSKYITVQNTVSGNLFMDFGIRKKIMNGKAVVNASVRDVFASRFQESEISNENFYVYSYGRRGRFITLGFSYGFGKGEAMQYSGGGHRH